MQEQRITTQAPKVNDAKGSPGYISNISMKFTKVEVYTNLFKIVCGIPLRKLFYLLQANLWSTFIVKLSEDKHRYFKRNFDEKNYTHFWKNTFGDEMKTKWMMKSFGETNDLFQNLVFQYFFYLVKTWNAISELLPSTKTSFSQKF